MIEEEKLVYNGELIVPPITKNNTGRILPPAI